MHEDLPSKGSAFGGAEKGTVVSASKIKRR
jgi:hypothetical protein